MATPVQRARDILQQAELLYPAEQVQASLHKVARQINAALADTHPLVLSVMGGAVVFTGQLLPLLDFPLDFDYVHVSRYGDATHGGKICWKVEPCDNVRGRVVLVLDDILDEGHTLAALRQRVMELGASRVYCAVFADKRHGRANRSRPISSGWSCRIVLCSATAWISKGRGAICPPFMQ